VTIFVEKCHSVKILRVLRKIQTFSLVIAANAGERARDKAAKAPTLPHSRIYTEIITYETTSDKFLSLYEV